MGIRRKSGRRSKYHHFDNLDVPPFEYHLEHVNKVYMQIELDDGYGRLALTNKGLIVEGVAIFWPDEGGNETVPIVEIFPFENIDRINLEPECIVRAFGDIYCLNVLNLETDMLNKAHKMVFIIPPNNNIECIKMLNLYEDIPKRDRPIRIV